MFLQAEHSAGELRLSAGHLDVHVHHLRLLRPPRIRRRPLVSEKAMMAGQYRVGQVVVHLGWGDFNLVNSLGW